MYASDAATETSRSHGTGSLQGAGRGGDAEMTTNYLFVTTVIYREKAIVLGAEKNLS